MSTYPTTQTFFLNARKPDLTAYVTVGQTNTAKNYTSAISCKFFLRDESDGSMKIDGIAGTIDDAANGVLKYAWADGDLDTLGRYSAWFEVYWGASSTLPDPTSAAEVIVANPYDTMVT